MQHHKTVSTVFLQVPIWAMDHFPLLHISSSTLSLFQSMEWEEDITAYLVDGHMWSRCWSKRLCLSPKQPAKIHGANFTATQYPGIK